MIVLENKTIMEAGGKDFMTEEEEQLKKRLLALLRDDGKGHHHALYAKRLSDYIINIVPIGREPSTAAISFDDGIIYINRGFLVDADTFGQLNVIMRHELCHNLLMHQIRMVRYLSQIPESHLRLSASIHDVLNIIEDFEISNKKYSAEDKQVVRATWLNGQLISGLVTEDHRQNWIDMSLEEMYDALMNEIKIYGHSTTNGYTDSSATISHSADKLYRYKDDNQLVSPSDFYDLQEFKDVLLQQSHGQLAKEYLDIFDNLEEAIVNDPNVPYTKKDIETMINGFKQSPAIGKHDIISPVTGEIICTTYTPEENRIAIEILKLIAGNTSYTKDYQAWYNEILDTITNSDPPLTDDEIQSLLDCLA